MSNPSANSTKTVLELISEMARAQQAERVKETAINERTKATAELLFELDTICQKYSAVHNLDFATTTLTLLHLLAAMTVYRYRGDTFCVPIATTAQIEELELKTAILLELYNAQHS